jgi:hypothetical protein
MSQEVADLTQEFTSWLEEAYFDQEARAAAETDFAAYLRRTNERGGTDYRRWPEAMRALTEAKSSRPSPNREVEAVPLHIDAPEEVAPDDIVLIIMEKIDGLKPNEKLRILARPQGYQAYEKLARLGFGLPADITQIAQEAFHRREQVKTTDFDFIYAAAGAGLREITGGYLSIEYRQEVKIAGSKTDRLVIFTLAKERLGELGRIAKLIDNQMKFSQLRGLVEQHSRSFAAAGIDMVIKDSKAKDTLARACSSEQFELYSNAIIDEEEWSAWQRREEAKMRIVEAVPPARKDERGPADTPVTKPTASPVRTPTATPAPVPLTPAPTAPPAPAPQSLANLPKVSQETVGKYLEHRRRLVINLAWLEDIKGMLKDKDDIYQDVIREFMLHCREFLNWFNNENTIPIALRQALLRIIVVNEVPMSDMSLKGAAEAFAGDFLRLRDQVYILGALFDVFDFYLKNNGLLDEPEEELKANRLKQDWPMGRSFPVKDEDLLWLLQLNKGLDGLRPVFSKPRGQAVEVREKRAFFQGINAAGDFAEMLLDDSQMISEVRGAILMETVRTCEVYGIKSDFAGGQKNPAQAYLERRLREILEARRATLGAARADADCMRKFLWCLRISAGLESYLLGWGLSHASIHAGRPLVEEKVSFSDRLARVYQEIIPQLQASAKKEPPAAIAPPADLPKVTRAVAGEYLEQRRRLVIRLAWLEDARSLDAREPRVKAAIQAFMRQLQESLSWLQDASKIPPALRIAAVSDEDLGKLCQAAQGGFLGLSEENMSFYGRIFDFLDSYLNTYSLVEPQELKANRLKENWPQDRRYPDSPISYRAREWWLKNNKVAIDAANTILSSHGRSPVSRKVFQDGLKCAQASLDMLDDQARVMPAVRSEILEEAVGMIAALGIETEFRGTETEIRTIRSEISRLLEGTAPGCAQPVSTQGALRCVYIFQGMAVYLIGWGLVTCSEVRQGRYLFDAAESFSKSVARVYRDLLPKAREIEVCEQQDAARKAREAVIETARGRIQNALKLLREEKGPFSPQDLIKKVTAVRNLIKPLAPHARMPLEKDLAALLQEKAKAWLEPWLSKEVAGQSELAAFEEWLVELENLVTKELPEIKDIFGQLLESDFVKKRREELKAEKAAAEQLVQQKQAALVAAQKVFTEFAQSFYAARGARQLVAKAAHLVALAHQAEKAIRSLDTQGQQSLLAQFTALANELYTEIELDLQGSLGELEKTAISSAKELGDRQVAIEHKIRLLPAEKRQSYTEQLTLIVAAKQRQSAGSGLGIRRPGVRGLADLWAIETGFKQAGMDPAAILKAREVAVASCGLVRDRTKLAGILEQSARSLSVYSQASLKSAQKSKIPAVLTQAIQQAEAALAHLVDTGLQPDEKAQEKYKDLIAAIAEARKYLPHPPAKPGGTVLGCGLGGLQGMNPKGVAIAAILAAVLIFGWPAIYSLSIFLIFGFRLRFNFNPPQPDADKEKRYNKFIKRLMGLAGELRHILRIDDNLSKRLLSSAADIMLQKRQGAQRFVPLYPNVQAEDLVAVYALVSLIETAFVKYEREYKPAEQEELLRELKERNLVFGSFAPAPAPQPPAPAPQKAAIAKKPQGFISIPLLLGLAAFAALAWLALHQLSPPDLALSSYAPALGDTFPIGLANAGSGISSRYLPCLILIFAVITMLMASWLGAASPYLYMCALAMKEPTPKILLPKLNLPGLKWGSSRTESNLYSSLGLKPGDFCEGLKSLELLSEIIVSKLETVAILMPIFNSSALRLKICPFLILKNG